MVADLLVPEDGRALVHLGEARRAFGQALAVGAGDQAGIEHGLLLDPAHLAMEDEVAGLEMGRPGVLAFLGNGVQARGSRIGLCRAGPRREGPGKGRLFEIHFRRAQGEPPERLLEAGRLAGARAQVLAGDMLAIGEDQHAVIGAHLDEIGFQLRLVLDVAFGLAPRDLVERRLGDIEIAALDHLRHLPVEEGEQEGADMRAVDIGVGHDDDLVVAHLLDVEIVAPDARAQRGDQRADLVGTEHLVEARALHVQDLAAQGQDGLVLPVAALFGRAAGAVTLDDEQF